MAHPIAAQTIESASSSFSGHRPTGAAYFNPGQALPGKSHEKMQKMIGPRHPGNWDLTTQGKERDSQTVRGLF